MRRGLWARTEPRPCGVGCGRGWSLARAAGGRGLCVTSRAVRGHRVGGARSPRGRCAVTAWVVRGHRVAGARSPRGRCAVTAWVVRGHRVGGAWSPRGRCAVTAWAVRGHRAGGTWSPRGRYCVSAWRECCVPPMEPRASASGLVLDVDAQLTGCVVRGWSWNCVRGGYGRKALRSAVMAGPGVAIGPKPSQMSWRSWARWTGLSPDTRSMRVKWPP